MMKLTTIVLLVALLGTVSLAGAYDMLTAEWSPFANQPRYEPYTDDSEMEAESDAMSMWPEARCASDALNVRDGPRMNARVLYTMAAGTRVTVNSISNGVWANLGGGKYCHKDYLKPCAAQTLCATAALNVRDAPSTNARILYTVAVGTKVIVQSISGDWANLGGGKYCHKGWLGPCGGGGGGTAPMYKQCDARWGNHRLGQSGTICGIGCLMTSVAMGMAKHGRKINGQTTTPASLNQFLLRNGGYYGNLYVWGAVSRFQMAYQGQTSNQATIKAACTNGRKIVTLNVNRGGHWVLCTGVTGNGFTVNDPGANKGVYTWGEVGVAGIYNV